MSSNLNSLVQSECGASNPLVRVAQQISMKPPVVLPSTLGRDHTNQKQLSANFSREFMQQNCVAIGQQLVGGNKNPSAHSPSAFQQMQHVKQAGGFIASTTSGLVAGGKLASDFLSEQQDQIVDGIGRVRVSSSPPAMSMASQSLRYFPSSSASTTSATASQLNHHLNAMSSSGHQSQYNEKSAAIMSAGDQLEAKYRDDLISQSSCPPHQKAQTDDIEFWQTLSQKYIGQNVYDNIAKSRLDEMTTSEEQADELRQDEWKDNDEQVARENEDLDEYNNSGWAEDIQTSMSPLRDDEYIFDERNPLKDQFEDPFAEGLERLKCGDIPSAALLFEAAVQLEPEKAIAWRYLGLTQAQNEKDSSAIRALKICLKLDSNDQEARLAISVSLANETNHREACKYLLEWLINCDRYKNSVKANLKEFLELDSELLNDPFYINSLDQKHYKYVRDKFVEAARLSPKDPDPQVQNSLGVLFNMQGEYEKAVDCFKSALSVRSTDSLLWNRLGACLANGNKSDEAVIAYRKALELSPGSLRTRYNLAISLIHLNTYDEAAKQCVQILNMQAAGKGSKNAQIRTRSITSTAIWNTLRTIATLMNKPELYPVIDGRDLGRCNREILSVGIGPTMSLSSSTSATSTSATQMTKSS